MTIKVSEIMVKDRLREVNDNIYIQELSQSISNVGLLHNIVINKDNELIAGAHRLQAVKLLGWEEVEVKILDTSSIINQLQEMEENLSTKKLTPMEVSIFRNRQKELYETLNPHSTKEHKVLKNLQNYPQSDEESVDSFVSDLSKRSGKSERTIQNELSIFTNMKNDELVEELIHIDDLSEVNTRRISKLNEEEQKRVLEQIQEIKQSKGSVTNLDIVSMGREKHTQQSRKETSESIKSKILNQSFKLVKSDGTDRFNEEFEILKSLVKQHEEI